MAHLRIIVALLASSSASAAPVEDSPQSSARRLLTTRTSYNVYQARTASCVFDVLHASSYLAQAGTAIDASTRKCHNPTNNGGANGALCTVSISQIIESFAYAASFLSSVAIDCTDQANFEAKCAASITALIGSIGDFAQAGAGMSYDCKGAKNHPGPVYMWTSGRRLNESDTAATDGDDESLKDEEQRRLWSPIQNPVWTRDDPNSAVAQKNKKAETAFCAIYATQATWFLARAGLNINEATHDCSGITDATPQTHKAICGADVSGILLSLFNVASYISGAVAQCQHGLNAPAACTADVTKLAAAMSTVAYAAQGIFTSCVNHCCDYCAHCTNCINCATVRRLSEDYGFANSTDSGDIIV